MKLQLIITSQLPLKKSFKKIQKQGEKTTQDLRKPNCCLKNENDTEVMEKKLSQSLD